MDIFKLKAGVESVLSSIGSKIAAKGTPLYAESMPVSPEKTMEFLDAIGVQNSALLRASNSYKKAILAQIELLKESASEIVEREFIFPKRTVSGADNGPLKKTFEVFSGTQSGSNRGFWALDKADGTLYYAKFSDKYHIGAMSQSESEVLASKIYALMGFDVPKTELIMSPDGKEIGLLSEFVPNLSPVRSYQKGVEKGFGADVFLANWDGVCSGNLQTDGQKFFKLDFGGALEYRALSERKDFKGAAKEIYTLLDPGINKEAAKIYSKMTLEDSLESIKRVLDIDDEALKKLVFEYAGKDSDKIYSALLKRKEFLSYVLEIANMGEISPKTSLFEYFYTVSERVLNTPLAGFETYARKHPEINTDEVLRRYNDVKVHNLSPRFEKDMIRERRRLIRASRGLKPRKTLVDVKDMNAKNFDTLGNTDRERFDGFGRLTRLLNKAHITEDATLYRGAGAGDFGDRLKGVDSGKFLDTVYREGDYFVLPTIPCTSIYKAVAADFSDGIVFRINAPRGTNGIYMEKLFGSTMDKAYEGEVLLKKNLVFQFKNRTPFFDYDLIDVDIAGLSPGDSAVCSLSADTFGLF